jgi:hypothetical protein
MTYKPKIPSVKDILKVVEEFNFNDWIGLDAAKVPEYVHELDKYFVSKFGFIFRTIRQSNTDKLPQKIYRVRKYNLKINEGLISEFSNPPASATTFIQRANLPFHPVFYCAPSAHTALLETLLPTFDKETENLYYLTEWTFRENQPAYVTPFIFGDYNHVASYNEMGKKALVDLKSKIATITDEEEKSLEAVLKGFSKLFEYKDSHIISAYLGHIHLYATSNIRTDIFMYPSIQTDKRSINFAIHPNAVIHKLFLNRVFIVKINNYHFDIGGGAAKFDLSLEDRLGINNHHGYLIWRNLPDEDFNDFKKLFPEEEH